MVAPAIAGSSEGATRPRSVASAAASGSEEPGPGRPGRRRWSDPSGRTERLAADRSSAMPAAIAASSNVSILLATASSA